ncbi:MAG: enolase C-terminal domain-like protein [Fuerstiella sp.]|nr:enolase C-terminal domain-like protein [Fuerstiella sp.]
MKIASIEAIPVQIPLRPERRMISALGKHDLSEFVLVRLTTDDGLVGAGEATVTARWSGETVWGAQAIIERMFGPILIGCDPHDIDTISARMDAVAVGNWFAKAAIEMACWDVVGKAAEKPVYELLGGAVRPLTIRNRFSLGAYEPKIAHERAQQLVAAGFQTIKVKVGTDPSKDVDRVIAVREAIGADTELTIDANGGWSFNDAAACLSQLTDCDVALVEQPLVRGDYAETKKLREQFGIRILADESCFDEVHIRELIERKCCDAITLYPGKQGGIAKARAMAAHAGRHDIPCTIGSNLEWDVGAAAMMHYVVSTPNVQIETVPGDCLGPSYHEFSIVREPLLIEGPFTTLPTSAGLGVDVDWNLVSEHATG